VTQRADKDSLPLDKPRRTPGHPTKSHIVKTNVGGKEKIIRFGEQGAETAGKPKAGESDRMKQKRASFKSRHAKNIAKGKSSPAYWANKVKWADGGAVKLAAGGSAALALIEQMRRSGAQSQEFDPVLASTREQRARPTRRPPSSAAFSQTVPTRQVREPPLPLPPTPPAMRPDENPPPDAPPNPMRFDEGNPHVATAISMAERYNLPRDIFLSLIQQESRFNPTAVSPRGAIGLGQLMPATARELNVDPRDPMQNLEGSARYLRQMLDQFGSMELALAAYNAGPGRVRRAGNTIPNIRETQDYVPSILRRAGVSTGPEYAEGGLADLDQKYAEGGRVRRTLRDELRDIEAEIRGERPQSLGVTVARGMGEGGGGIAGVTRRVSQLGPMRVYHAGSDFENLNPGTFTNTDRAAVEAFQQQMRAPKLHEFEITPRNIGGEEDVYEAARRYGVFFPDTPAGQYLEQGDNAVFDEAADILSYLRGRGFDSIRLDDGVSKDPSIVILDPSIARRYAEGGAVMSDEEYDRRLLSRMKAQTGRVSEPTRAEQMQALRNAGTSAAEGLAEVLLPQSPLDVALMVAMGPGGRAARLAGAGALAALEPSEAEASGLLRRAGEGARNIFYRGVPRLNGRVSEVSGLHMKERGAAQPSNPYLKANTRDYAWASDNPAVGSSYTHFGGAVIPLELVEPPGAVLNARNESWDRFFFEPGSRPTRGQAPDLAPEFKEALEDPAVKSILVNNILDYGLESQKPGFRDWLSNRVYGKPYSELNAVEEMMLSRKGLTGNNLLIKDPSVVRYSLTGEPVNFAEGGLAELEQKYAEGGAVNAEPTPYNADAVDALVKQIEAEYV
jgi:soluble lytic murein transglycosylase-like protein